MFLFYKAEQVPAHGLEPLSHHGTSFPLLPVLIPARKQGNATGTRSACSGGIAGGRDGTRALTQPWSSLGKQLSLQWAECLLFLN